jgi:hypothetical protein
MNVPNAIFDQILPNVMELGLALGTTNNHRGVIGKFAKFESRGSFNAGMTGLYSPLRMGKVFPHKDVNVLVRNNYLRVRNNSIDQIHYGLLIENSQNVRVKSTRTFYFFM